MQDTSSIGVRVYLRASITYPQGITFSAFPEDSDIGTTGDNDIASSASGVNGDLIWWKTVSGINVQVPLIPNTSEEALMDILFEANRGVKGRMPKKDIITMVVTNPVTGVVTTYKNGFVRSGNVGKTYGGDGRIKTKNYGFTFEDKI